MQFLPTDLSSPSAAAMRAGRPRTAGTHARLCEFGYHQKNIHLGIQLNSILTILQNSTERGKLTYRFSPSSSKAWGNTDTPDAVRGTSNVFILTSLKPIKSDNELSPTHAAGLRPQEGTDVITSNNPVPLVITHLD